MALFKAFRQNFLSRKNPLFFTREGALDFGPAAWLATIMVGLVSFLLAGFGQMSITTAAWAFMGSFVTITAIAGAAEKRAYWIAKSDAPGQVAQGIAEAGPEVYGREPIYRVFDEPSD